MPSCSETSYHKICPEIHAESTEAQELLKLQEEEDSHRQCLIYFPLPYSHPPYSDFLVCCLLGEPVILSYARNQFPLLATSHACRQFWPESTLTLSVVV